MIDLQTLVEADEAFRGQLIAELSDLDRRWALINRNAGTDPDPKQVRVGLQIKFALLDLVQNGPRARSLAASLVDLARSSPEFSKLARDQLEMLLVSSPRTALRVTARSAMQYLDKGDPLPLPANETMGRTPPIFVVAADGAQRVKAEKLAEALTQNGMNIQGIDALDAGRDVKLTAPASLEIRFTKGSGDESFRKRLAALVEKALGETPKLVGVSSSDYIDPGSYEVWFSKGEQRPEL